MRINEKRRHGPLRKPVDRFVFWPVGIFKFPDNLVPTSPVMNDNRTIHLFSGNFRENKYYEMNGKKALASGALNPVRFLFSLDVNFL